MTALSTICLSTAIALTYLDLTSPKGVMFSGTVKSALSRLNLFGLNTWRFRSVYQIWIGLVILASLLIWSFSDSLVFASLTIVSGIGGSVIFLQRLVDRKSIKFEAELLRFIQLLKSEYQIGNSLSSSIMATIQKIRGPENNPSNQQSCMGLFLDSISESIGHNESLVAAIRRAKTRLIEQSGAQIKSINLFIGFISSIQDTGHAGRAFEMLERRIESDLAIASELDAVTSGAKLQMGFLAMVPIFVLTLFSFLMPEMVSGVFQQTTGQILISTGFTTTLAAVWLTQKILNVKV